jgi:hypothetical protein
MIDFVCHVCVCGLCFVFLRVLKTSPKYFQHFFIWKTGKTQIDLREIIYKTKATGTSIFFSFFLNSYITKTRDICSCLNLFLFFLVFNLFVPCLYSHPILIPSSINQPTQFSVHLPPTNPLFTWCVHIRSLLPYAF